MAKFNPILMKKVEREEQEEKKQEQLKEEVGIDDDRIVLKEKNWKDYGKQFFRCLIYILFVILVFVGIVATLNPTSQAIMKSIIKQCIL